MTRTRLLTVMQLLSAAGVTVSGYLFWSKVTSQFFCPVGNCEVVNNSPYAYIGPFPVSLLGISYYAFLIVLLQWVKKEGDASGFAKLLTAGVLGGFLFSLYLTIVEVAVIQAICIWCVISFLIVSALTWLEYRRKLHDHVYENDSAS